MRADVSTDRGALAFVEEHGIVLEGGRGPVRSLVEAITGEAVRGSWWGHPKAQAIFRATRAVRDSPDVVVCRLVGGRITYIHRRLWPAVVRLVGRIGRSRLGAIREEHTTSGAHRLVTIPFPQWVSATTRAAADRLSEAEALQLCGEWLDVEESAKAAARKKGGPRTRR